MTTHTKKPSPMPVLVDNIPEELRRIPQYVGWKWVERDGKFDKPPVNIKTFGPGSSTDESTWVSFNEAVAALPKLDGIGLALGDGVGLVGLDFDSCVDPATGFIKAEVEEILESLDTYAEISPSKTGIRAWMSGAFDKSKWRSKRGDIEVYVDKRYMTVSGHCYGGKKPIREIGDSFFAFMDKHLSREQPNKTTTATTPIEHSDDDKRIKAAFLACQKVEIKEDESDGSGRLVRYCRQCHRAGLSADGCLTVVRMLEIQYPFPKRFDDSQIRARYQSATSQTEFGEALVVYESTDYGVTKRVRDYCQGRILYVPEWGKWLAWNGRMFEVDRHGLLIEAIVAVSKQMLAETPEGDEKAIKAWQSFCLHYQSKRGIENIEKLARSYMAVDYRDLDCKTDLWHAANGVVRLSDGSKMTLEPHDPANLNTRVSQVAFVPGSPCPRWRLFIEEITAGDYELATYLQKVVGYCLTGIPAEEFFILHGGGRNGKGVFTRTILKLLGEYGGVVNQDLLMASPNQHPTQFAYLYGKRCVVAQETDQDCRLNESQVKMLTGGDPIQCRRMREDLWTFDPQHKIMLATNSVPMIRGTDHGIWSRIKLIPFTVTFANPDRTLESKLDVELPGILQWAIEGFRMFRLEGFAEPDCVKIAKQEYRHEMSIVQQFVEDCCVIDATKSTACSTLYQNFKLYTEQHGHFLCSPRKLFADLAAFGVTKGRTSSARIRIGIGLKSEFEDEST